MRVSKEIECIETEHELIFQQKNTEERTGLYHDYLCYAIPKGIWKAIILRAKKDLEELK